MDDDIKRLEKKIDKIIDFFNIDEKPRRSLQELHRLADRDAKDILNRRGLKLVDNNLVAK